MPTTARVLLSTPQTSRYTVSTTIQPWSTATFDLSINSKDVLRLRRKERVDLVPYHRQGENTVEVRYRTDDGKSSFYQPAILILKSWDGGRQKTELRITASLDNPRGKMSVRLQGS